MQPMTRALLLGSAACVSLFSSALPAATHGWQNVTYDLAGTRHQPLGSAFPVGNDPFTPAWSVPGIIARSGDVTGDGQQELVVHRDASLFVYDRTGALVSQFPTGAPQSHGNLMLADLDGDGRLEIFHGFRLNNSTVTVRAYDSLGNVLRSYSRPGAHDSAIHPDALVALEPGGPKRLVAFQHCGYSIDFRGVVVFDAATGLEIGAYEQGPFVSASSRGQLSIGDVTGDAALEILHGSGGVGNSKCAGGACDNQSWAFAHRTDASVLWMRQLHGSGYVNADLRAVDLDGDGQVQVFATAYDHGWGQWEGNMGIAYLLHPSTGQTLPGYERNFGRPVWIGGVADLDGDGVREILVSHKDGATQTSSLLALQPIPGLPTLSQFQVTGAVVELGAIVDLNGDGTPNVLALAGSQVYVLDSQLQLMWSWSAGSTVIDVWVSDLTGNGIHELVVVTSDEIHVLQADVLLAQPFCFGDGSGSMCPCGNQGWPGEGCANATGRGAVLSTSGAPSVGSGSLVLNATGMVPFQPGLFFQGLHRVNSGLGQAFGDGLRCAGGQVQRLQVRTADGLGSAGTSVDLAATGGVGAGDQRTYQLWYRDAWTSPCGSGFNLSNGLQITWAP